MAKLLLPEELGMEKSAATRQIKIIRDLIAKGKTYEAGALAHKLRQHGMLKVTGPGTNVDRLGRGVEAVADLVVGAKASPKALAVRKAFDPKSPLVSKQSLADKVNAYRKVRGTKDEELFAKMYGGLGRGKSGGRYLTTEAVPYHFSPSSINEGALSMMLRKPGGSIEKARKSGVELSARDITKARMKKQDRIREHLIRQGMSPQLAQVRASKVVPSKGGPLLGDLHHQNVRETPEGGLKILDFFAPPTHRIGDIDRAGNKIKAVLENPRLSPLAFDRKIRSAVGDTFEGWAGKRPSRAQVIEGGGLLGGPSNDPDGIRRALSGLGGGSRQAKKVRGSKAEAGRIGIEPGMSNLPPGISSKARSPMADAAKARGNTDVPKQKRRMGKLLPYAVGVPAAAGVGVYGLRPRKEEAV